MNILSLQLITVVGNDKSKSVVWKRQDTYEEFSLTIIHPSQHAQAIPKQSTAKKELHLQLEEN